METGFQYQIIKMCVKSSIIFFYFFVAAIEKIQAERDEKRIQDELDKANNLQDDLDKMTERGKGGDATDDGLSNREERQKKREENRGDGFQDMEGVEEGKDLDKTVELDAKSVS